jgi:hypothetical protein
MASFLARPWGIYPHALFGALALACGPFQFRRTLLLHRPQWHRRLGTLYVFSAVLTGVVGVYMSFYSFGGIVTHIGFGALGLALFCSTVFAYRSARQKRWAHHREWMVRSFALLFAAVTLRVELPLFINVWGEFETAYLFVSWFCWVPNLLVAESYLHITRSREPLGFLRERRPAHSGHQK